VHGAAGAAGTTRSRVGAQHPRAVRVVDGRCASRTPTESRRTSTPPRPSPTWCPVDGAPGQQPAVPAEVRVPQRAHLLRYGHAREAEAAINDILRVYCSDQTVAGAAFDDLNNLSFCRAPDELEALAHEQAARPARASTVGDSDASNVDRSSASRWRSSTSGRARSGRTRRRLCTSERGPRDGSGVNSNRGHRAGPLWRPTTSRSPTSAPVASTPRRRPTAHHAGLQQHPGTIARAASSPARTAHAARQHPRGVELPRRVNLERIFDYDSSIRYYGHRGHGQPLRQRRPTTPSHVHDALASIALINTNLGRWDARPRCVASNFAPRSPRPVASARRRSSATRRCPSRRPTGPGALTSLQDYLRAPRPAPDTAQFRVRAQYNIALTHRSLGNDRNYRARCARW
jgi:hypothetical protein